MTRADAQQVAEMVARSGRRLRTIFISNSRPDKYLGLPVLTARFPEARVVSTAEVVADIEARGPRDLERLRTRYDAGTLCRLPARASAPGVQSAGVSGLRCEAVDGDCGPSSRSPRTPILRVEPGDLAVLISDNALEAMLARTPDDLKSRLESSSAVDRELHGW